MQNLKGLSEEELGDIADHLRLIGTLADLLMVHVDEMREALGILAPKEVKPARKRDPEAICKTCSLERQKHDKDGPAYHAFVLLRGKPKVQVSVATDMK
ncbi:MAG: hypothetical protein Q8P12_02645 [bacterium]|nr:hypothetical protein [bacterium]MDZ4345150.1 hypothetical protein [Candidatus Binatia bacterium]